MGEDPRAELRGSQLLSGGVSVDLASPYLTLAAVDDQLISRGLADALGLVLRHHDTELHAAARPVNLLERVVFDMLEQLRCQALAPDLCGLRSNLDALSEAWCQNARASNVAESGVGLLVYTLAHMARARLRLGMTSEEVDSIIEGPRATLGRLVGHGLKRLFENIDDQGSYGQASREIARLLTELVDDAGLADEAADAARYRMLVPLQWFDANAQPPTAEEAMLASVARGAELEHALLGLGDYAVFTRAYDVEKNGGELYRPEVLRELRAELDGHVRDQAVSAQRIAKRLRRLFGCIQPDDWQFGVDEGVIDGRRLPQLILSPTERQVFRLPRPVVRSNTAVALLMDNSGSMRMQRFEALATLADTLSRALDLAGVTNEVLGFTTAAWNGGRAMDEWKKAGQPAEPGRLTELAHIVYKDADTSWKRARPSLAAMLRPMHFAESVDGEAIIWAHSRLRRRPEQRKLLVVVSDGAPGESATNRTNREGFLDDHLRLVVDYIERRSPVEIAALTVDQDVGTRFRRSRPVDLDATLSIGTYRVLEALFSPVR